MEGVLEGVACAAIHGNYRSSRLLGIISAVVSPIAPQTSLTVESFPSISVACLLDFVGPAATGLYAGLSVDEFSYAFVFAAEVLKVFDELSRRGGTLLLMRPKFSRWARHASRSSLSFPLILVNYSRSPRSPSTSRPASSTCPALTLWVYYAALRSLANELFLSVSAWVAFWACCASVRYLSFSSPI